MQTEQLTVHIRRCSEGGGWRGRGTVRKVDSDEGGQREVNREEGGQREVNREEGGQKRWTEGGEQRVVHIGRWSEREEVMGF